MKSYKIKRVTEGNAKWYLPDEDMPSGVYVLLSDAQIDKQKFLNELDTTRQDAADLEAENSSLKEDILCFEAMKEGVGGRISNLEAENIRLVEALRKIANPIGYLQSKAKKEGAQLDGLWAVRLANDAGWLKLIACEALAKGE